MQLYKWIHKPCGGVFWYYRRRAQSGDIIKAEDIVYVDGREGSNGDPITCSTCGQFGEPLELLDRAWIDVEYPGELVNVDFEV